MPSLFPGFEYDIFISYRQKDNKHDGWVTEFVNNLKGELESTFKEDISVYFDINPQDGLLETHDVDASLKVKLKCLIFIPIISRTYCDPRSFAWEHEFRAFVEQASQDSFGLKVKLSNGNVASRVLPVRIHELDIADIKECEMVLGGALRGIEFIYKESGIDKPLSREDDDKKNLNNTKYRIQIIKVAQAIKEIIRGLKAEPVQTVTDKNKTKDSIETIQRDKKKVDSEKRVNSLRRAFIYAVTFFSILAFAVFYVYPKIQSRNTLEELRSSGERISIVIMPFRNMTGDTTKNFWQEMIQDNLITSLSNDEELIVRRTESINQLIHSKGQINYSSLTPAVASNISRKLNANIFIYGSIHEAGSTVRLSAQLTNSKTQVVFKSLQVNGDAASILHLTDSLSNQVRNSLILTKLATQAIPDLKHFGSTNSPEAYRHYINGMNAFTKGDYSTAITFFFQSLALDSNFLLPKQQLIFAYGNQGMNEEARKWCLKVYEMRDRLSVRQRYMVDFDYAAWYGTPYDEIRYLKGILEIDDQLPAFLWQLGTAYLKLNEYEKAIANFEKSLEIYHKWGIKPLWVPSYTSLGYAYHKMGQYTKEELLYNKAEQDFPDDPALICNQAILALSKKDTLTAKGYIDRFLSIQKENSVSDAVILTILAGIYQEADLPEMAEKYYRNAIKSTGTGSDNSDYLNILAWFLIDTDRNVDEGIRLSNEALLQHPDLTPDKYYLLHTKGWGLYKQGKYNEALDCLEKCWELKPFYDHGLYIHIEQAKEAIENKKN